VSDEVWRRRDHYALLEVERDADEEALKSAHKLQMQAWHPDKFSSKYRPVAEERVTAVLQAWEVLKDPARRAYYDLTLPDVDLEQPGSWPEPLQNVPDAWKQLAAFLKDEDLGSPFVRKMAFTAGDYIERRKELSAKQRPYAEEAWKLGVQNGFEPRL
jgi:DnaJ-class molecular chaperone